MPVAAGFFAKANLMASAYPAVSPMDAGVFFGGTWGVFATGEATLLPKLGFLCLCGHCQAWTDWF